MRKNISVLLFTLGILLTGCQITESDDPSQNETDEAESVQDQKEVEQKDTTNEEDNLDRQDDIAIDSSPTKVAEEVVQALKVKDMQTLSHYVHPTDGIRFSPYGYIDVENHQVLSSDQVAGLLNDTTVYIWGHFDGSGQPIEMTFEEYSARFVYDQDYAEAEQVSVNKRLGHGNTIDNTSDVYPHATTTEYHFTGFDPQFDGMDWKSLRIVLVKEEDQWFVVGIIHDEWTI
jgi:hypothetical protein